MALEYLDLENKLYIPTQKLITQFQLDLLALWASLKTSTIEAHQFVAELGKQWYDDPVTTSQAWYQAATNSAKNLYALARTEWLPQAEENYQRLSASIGDFIEQAQDNLSYAVDHPEQISAEAIETITDTLTSTGNLSAELIDELQSKSRELVSLLLEHPLQTLESAYTEVLAALLNSYFELVSNLLAML